ncbi:asparagine synthase-related protein [Streptomyces litchfieldiae]|uniref:Asparagine synthase-related protein n=1 Tax=Streptomyces litchfieldiae TaxID=3075543 RepID=A0ABU2MQ88_9ACTN|nr:asparagine synthase-related protein [Streptomyces sp. DSM 44938]MDT0343788.1 asparagine synthase-related protein [Streptomyces sp. DSM 44938]
MTDEAWFVVLPDAAGGPAVARALEAGCVRVLTHASGRPWVVGRWPGSALTAAAAGRTRLALLGQGAPGAEALRRALAGVRDPGDLDALAAGLPGSVHLLASFDGLVRAQGTVSGVRAVFHTTVHGMAVAGDRPATLAALVGAGVDDEALALRLLPGLSSPLRERPVWRGVFQVPEDSWLSLGPAGAARVTRWWRPPAVALTREQGAPGVRAALTEAVRARVGRLPDGRLASSDLSGGTDSGTITCLAAAARPAPLLTVRAPQRDPGGEDAAFARRLSGRLPGAEHLLLDDRRAPAMFGDLADPAGLVLADEPPIWVRSGAWFRHLMRAVAGRGSVLHLTGHGGDQLFAPHPAYLHTLLRSHPLTALRHARGRRALGRWSALATCRALADSRSFPAHLAHLARHLTDPPPAPRHPGLGWTPPLRMPGWATPDALATVRARLRGAADEETAPLGPDRATHGALDGVRYGGAEVRYAAGLALAHGVELAAPFLDDRVIEAALAVSPHHLGAPDRYKPLLAEAMRGLVPEDLLGRTTKGDYGEDAWTGLRRHRSALAGLFDGSELARRGLVDDVAVRAALRADHPTIAPLILLERTLACEMWLRALPGPRPTPAAVTEGAL